MVSRKHFRRLKHIYTSSSPSGDRVAIAYGRAELDGTIAPGNSDVVLNRMPHHRLLSDAASLAAGTLEKEQVVTAEQFTVDVAAPGYEGPVAATAEVVMAEPPHYVVQAELRGEDGELVAEALGTFRPSGDALPADPHEEQTEADPSTVPPPPASFMPVHTTPYGVLCLN